MEKGGTGWGKSALHAHSQFPLGMPWADLLNPFTGAGFPHLVSLQQSQAAVVTHHLPLATNRVCEKRS